MLVQEILKTKSDDGVVTVTPGTTVGGAADILSARRIGVLIVSQDGRTADGIISERDIVRELGRRGPVCLAEYVENVMTRNLVTCTRRDRADDILQRMTDGRFRHMPVIEDGQMIGLISLGDVVKARLMELSMEKEALEGMIKGF